jgi:hypothetical protein
MGSVRFAFALTLAGALFWVYGLTVLVFFAARGILPQKGGTIVMTFLAGLFGSAYLLIIWLLNALLAQELVFLIGLVPVYCVGSGFFSRLDLAGGESCPADPAVGAGLDSAAAAGFGETAFRALAEAALLGFLLLALALIREPLGLASLSLPGGPRGIVEIFSGEGDAFFPIQIAASSAGGFLLFGYALALFRHLRKRLKEEE